MPPRSPIRAGEINNDIDQRKYGIKDIIKIKESTVKYKVQHAALELVFIQIISLQASELSRSYHDASKSFHIQKLSIQVVEFSRATQVRL